MVARRQRRLLLAAVALALPAGVRAQRPPRVPRIGILMPSTAAGTANLVGAFVEGLGEHGYVEGSNVFLEYRYTEGHVDRVPALTLELVRANVEIIVSTTDPVIRAIQRHAPTMPIVMVNSSDPVGSGLVKTLARPGGNITGVTNLSPEISAKRMQLLREAVPQLERVAYLWNPDLPGAAEAYGEIEAAARTLKLQVRSAEARRAEDIERALAALASAPATALLVQAPNPVLYTARKRIAELAREMRLPSIFNRWEYVADGGLMSYGPNVPQMYRRAAGYVDQILKGAAAAGLPVEQPSKFELTINAQTAKTLGIAISRSVLLRADKIF